MREEEESVVEEKVDPANFLKSLLPPGPRQVALRCPTPRDKGVRAVRKSRIKHLEKSNVLIFHQACFFLPRAEAYIYILLIICPLQYCRRCSALSLPR